jgi:hypothetical protein
LLLSIDRLLDWLCQSFKKKPEWSITFIYISISRHKFTSRLYRHYKIAILAGIQAFIRNKSEYRKRLTRFPGQSIGKVLQCKELKNDDPFTLKLKEMAD